MYSILKFLDVGNVHINKDSCIYSIGKLEDLKNVVLPLLDKYTLLTTKYLDYLDFKKVVNLLIQNKTSSFLNLKITDIKNIINQMNLGRTVYNYSLIPSLIINPFWLLGFIEAEETFGFKFLKPYFQLGQHARNLIVLESIIKYIKSLPKSFLFSKFDTPLKISKTLHKNTNVYVIVITNIEILHDYFTPFLLSMSFKSRKNVNFFYWAFALYLHKYGYFSVKEGRSLVNNISNSINTARYSNKNSLSILQNLDIINSVLSIDLPVKLTPEMNHLTLSQSFARLVNLRQIWVYDDLKLISGSPFSSNADAQEAIGIAINSLAVGRNIDTGKNILNVIHFTHKNYKVIKFLFFRSWEM